MSIVTDYRYVNLLKQNLDNFKQIKENLFQFRCPICGDSKKDTLKARGYLYTHDGVSGYSFKCHNCGASLSFGNFLKIAFPAMYGRYIVETMKMNNLTYGAKKSPEDSLKATESLIKTDSSGILKGLTPVFKLPKEHPALQYVLNRKIPAKQAMRLYYTDEFQRWTNSIKNGQFRTVRTDRRIVIPFLDQDGKLFMYQGRSIEPNAQLRYISIKLDEGKSKIYGLDSVKFNREIYVTEGPIDSMFLPNALAVAGACYSDPLLLQYKDSITIVPDNERRNREVAANIESAIKLGYKVCLWRDGLNFKDINEAILNGYSTEELLQIIKEDTVRGFPGEIKFKTWVKH